MDSLFFELIQVAMGTRNSLSRKPSDAEWLILFEWCEKHAISGFVFPALDKLSKQGQKPPADLLFEWIGLFEQLKGENMLMNTEAARLTTMFENEGYRTAILKGQANALLYPDPLSRQPGDLDIWVSGGKKTVIRTMRKLGLLKGCLSKEQTDQATKKYHHIHLPSNEKGIIVEVHFRPSSGNHDPLTNRRLQTFLKDEIDRDNELTDIGFRVPTLRFALIMQLSHIQRHLIESGVGMRQIIDYYYLLKKCHADIHRPANTEITEKTLHYLGLKHIAGAVMWVLHEKFGLDETHFIMPMDEKKGKMLLSVVMEGGNFGQYSQYNQEGVSFTNAFKYRIKKYEFLKFNVREIIWGEIDYVIWLVKSIIERIRRRSLTLR